MEGLKNFWLNFKNWFLNTFIRLSDTAKPIVMIVCVILIFSLLAIALKKTKKDLKHIPFWIYLLAALVLGYFVWISVI